jgi:predicted nucleotidyltransferase component of viral defense system
MILPAEIQRKASSAGVRDQQIEKDYVLSWILNGIAHHHPLSHSLVFKGGTVLKKFYFRDYRFSEDLDFTLLTPDVSNATIFQQFQEVFEFVREAANIPLEIIEDNEHEDGGINFYIGYIGPLGGLSRNKKIKVDISKTELMVYQPVGRTCFKEYSDLDLFDLHCYTLEEIMVEKMRSVMQRMQARDYYDIWYLLEEHGIDVAFIAREFSHKCHHKGLDPATFFIKLQQRIPHTKLVGKVHYRNKSKTCPILSWWTEKYKGN